MNDLFCVCMQMEFSFGPQRWLPKESLQDRIVDDDANENYALGLHAPGFFDKILNVDNCLLQSHPANKVCTALSTAVILQDLVLFHCLSYLGTLFDHFPSVLVLT